MSLRCLQTVWVKKLGNEEIGQLTFYTSRFKYMHTNFRTLDLTGFVNLSGLRTTETYVQLLKETLRGICVCSIVLFASLLFSCARSISPSASAYYAASVRHHQLAQGEIPATDREWLSLIAELQGIIDADAKGKWAADAQYAIASCWIWLAQNRSDARLDSTNTSTEHAIDAFKNLLNTYPDSSYSAEAHYWLGYCLDGLGDNVRAATHYQTVLQRYLNQPISEQAQLQLARAYEREQHFTSAIATYQSLVKRSQNSHLVAQAKRRIAKLQSKQELPSKRTDLPPQRIAPSAPQDSAQSQPHPMPTKPSLVQQLGLGVRTVVIDPGHGGKDPGALSQTWGQEKVVALDVSKTLRDILVEKGYQVQLTRDGDIYLPLRDRTRFATTITPICLSAFMQMLARTPAYLASKHTISHLPRMNRRNAQPLKKISARDIR